PLRERGRGFCYLSLTTKNKQQDKTLTEYLSKIYYELLEHLKIFQFDCLFRIFSRAALYKSIHAEEQESIQNIIRLLLSTTIQGTPFLCQYWSRDFDVILNEYSI
ncbi:hypothetical protein MXB_2220, partial [Myxobolus squamalis]